MFIENITQTTIELVIGFITLIISIKFIGKRQISQKTPFDFISAIVMGELVGNAIYDKETNVFYIIYAITIWTILLVIIEKVTQKSPFIRMKVQGTPSFIIKNGLIEYNVLKKEGLDINEMLALLRSKDIFSIQDVDFVLLETGGDISVIKKENNSSSNLTFALIFDGNIIKNNLKLIEKEQSWLLNKLNKQNIHNMKEVLYCEYDTNKDSIYIQKHHDKTE